MDRGVESTGAMRPMVWALRRTVAEILPLWRATCPVQAEAQACSDLSAPKMLYDGAVQTYNTPLVSDEPGAAYLVWKPSDEELYYCSLWDDSDWTMLLDVIASMNAAPVGQRALASAISSSQHLFWA